MKFEVRHVEHLKAYEVRTSDNRWILITEKLLKHLKPGKRVEVDL